MRRLKQFAVKSLNLNSRANEGVDYFPHFIRVSDTCLKIYPFSVNKGVRIHQGCTLDESITITNKYGNLSLDNGERSLISSVRYNKMITKFLNDIESFVLTNLNELELLLISNNFSKVNFMYGGLYSEKLHKGLTRYFIHRKGTMSLKCHIWAKDEKDLILKLKETNLELNLFVWKINMDFK